MRRTIGTLTLVGLALFIPVTHHLNAQLSPGSAAALGTGNNYTALARGISAMGYNPAGLGMPDSPEFSLAFLPVYGQQALDPIGLSDLADVEGTLISDGIKEDWLQRISERGGQSGGFGADLSYLAFNAGRVGFQLSTLVRGATTLSEDGAELLLYGNAGRTGSAGDFSLGGSRFQGLAVSTVGLSIGLPLRAEGENGSSATLVLGGTLKYSMGHALALAQDLGSQVRSDPLGVVVRFPMIQSDTSDVDLNQGSGVGLDLGVDWQQGPLTLGVVVQNLFHSFEWNLEGMAYRPGEVLFSGEDSDASNFDPRPAQEAPQALKDAVAKSRFKPQLSFGAAYEASPDLTVTGDVRKRLGEGIEVGPELHLGLGLEYRGMAFLPLRLGAAKITDGFQIGGGFSLALGPVYLSWAGALQEGNLDGSVGSFSLTFGGY